MGVPRIVPEAPGMRGADGFVLDEKGVLPMIAVPLPEGNRRQAAVCRVRPPGGMST